MKAFWFYFGQYTLYIYIYIYQQYFSTIYQKQQKNINYIALNDFIKTIFKVFTL